MPHTHDRTCDNALTPQVVAKRIYRNFIEVDLKLDVEVAEELASTDAVLKELLESAWNVAIRSSKRYERC